jgi:hypothetical protein
MAQMLFVPKTAGFAKSKSAFVDPLLQLGDRDAPKS